MSFVTLILSSVSFPVFDFAIPWNIFIFSFEILKPIHIN